MEGFVQPCTGPLTLVLKIDANVLTILSFGKGEAAPTHPVEKISEPIHDPKLGVHVPIDHCIPLLSLTQNASALQFMLPIAVKHRQLDPYEVGRDKPTPVPFYSEFIQNPSMPPFPHLPLAWCCTS